jgi:hypothetical protein
MERTIKSNTSKHGVKWVIIKEMDEDSRNRIGLFSHTLEEFAMSITCSSDVEDSSCVLSYEAVLALHEYLEDVINEHKNRKNHL